MPDEPFAVIAGLVSIHGNPVAFVSVAFRPDHRVKLALPLGARICCHMFDFAAQYEAF
jgi:hypothetical protein